MNLSPIRNARRGGFSVAVGCASLFALTLGGWSGTARAQAATKVACVGEQTTHSDQLNRTVEYPAMLQKEIGATYDVENFGDCCATVLTGYPKQAETHPYLSGGSDPSFTQSLPFAPDVVVIGSWSKHDTEIADSLYAGVLDPAQFQTDYETLVTTYLDLPNKPTVLLSTPVPIPSGQPTGVTTTVILPTVQAIAAKYHLAIVPLYAAFLNQPQLYKDTTHVTDVTGLQTIANTVYTAITGKVPLADGGGAIEEAGAPAGDAGDGVDPTAPGASGRGEGEDASVSSPALPPSDDASAGASESGGASAAASANRSGSGCAIAATFGSGGADAGAGALAAIFCALGMLGATARRMRRVSPRRPRCNPVCLIVSKTTPSYDAIARREP